MHLAEHSISCPYCGESSLVLIEPSDMNQRYIEDCQICCRPINIYVSVSFTGDTQVSVFAENDV